MALIHAGGSSNLGHKVRAVAHGIGTIKAGLDIGRALWGVGSAVAPYVGALL